MKKILIVVGTRPNFIKVTQFRKEALAAGNVEIKIVHTGQHYDRNMADVFFEQFDLVPDYFMQIESGTPNTQMAKIMLALEKLILEQYTPDLLIVVGDVNSTFAAATTANKMQIPLAHLESGLRSYDRTMPEEFNRLAADELSDYYFVTEQSGLDNLLRDGRKKEHIFFVGNTMIDTMVAFEEKIQASDIKQQLKIGSNEDFVLMTIHRPSNVDNIEGAKKLLQLIDYITAIQTLIFPMHPRTTKRFEEYHLLEKLTTNKNLILTEPLDYFAFQKLIADCKYILTDSGGIQEESTFRRIPCLTIRPNTERPSTIEIGSNTLVEWDFELLKKYIDQIESDKYKQGDVPPLWDGKATKRIIEVIGDLPIGG
ncbi:MAG: UDP-N-acetylglucosamine 2-epimerase (non-hydrolyzing) [Chitinophagales bacterium]|nr:UDP-N-acetylglucosamine 2-epimerase (non-hydrolyzing) [Chitinophagales bacterium]MBP8755066.1 UDP-N-acetylglucosamine 2-epimerase (non-hydrolyzing) [Chitinophagales bacterium]MBP9188667.1 UDP-N-acetylglucosamine 2-epimerase (non-hydrolyzing) [Chitinophagales bacterium]MBP9548540.1 UDP-N-acetylglucosamine 2-epimerase (non-hydrolyzing) [Chitinophagales bacterium]MBP9705560.1 UDP-N-acetylglucosamine 2-epimerase (non-hydrolyzing) [Chitinophagales bacterium]